MPQLLDLTGRCFGRWTVISRAPNRRRSHPITYWLCRCVCGREKEVPGTNLTRGLSKSCGCSKLGPHPPRHKTHGMSFTPTYRSWRCMLNRCSNSKATKYPLYGARGITVCERWKRFENFLEDMGPRPADMTLDRLKNDLGYQPGNCRWATQKEQRNNRRDSHGR
jgi:hypothetical protein